MSIFATPPDVRSTPDSGPRILFLHGLEGSPAGDKAQHLATRWRANTPLLRSGGLRELQSRYPRTEWQEMPKKEFKDALDAVYADALAALAYADPDVVIGSSMGGAILARLILEGKYSGPAVFLAPAITQLLGNVALDSTRNSVWILAEVDDIVPNVDNINYCARAGGSLMLSIGDNHRLGKALGSGMIDCAIITALELDQSIGS